MNSRIIISLMFALVLSFVLGCSGGSNQPVQPGNEDQPMTANESGRQFWGAWTANFDLESNTVEVIPDRDVNFHFNVTPFIPTPTIQILGWDPVNQIINLNITLKNPTVLTGYDVRLIIYTDAIGHLLTNWDDWTGLFDIAGGQNINPFKAYAKAVANRKFGAGTQYMENCKILLPGFNVNVRFAVDASYPTNCKEPYTIDNYIQGTLYETMGSSAPVSMEVFDWQNDVSEVHLICNEVFGAPHVMLTNSGGNTFSGTMYNNTGAAAGTYSAQALVYSSNEPNIPLWDYFIVKVSEAGVSHVEIVKSIAKPTADTWYDIGVAKNGKVYVVADHPETENVNGTRTAISFNNDLTGMTVINPNTGMNDPDGLGVTQYFNRIDVTDEGMVVNNPGYTTMGSWEVSGALAVQLYAGNALSCGGGWTGCLGFKDVWNHYDANYGSVSLGWTESIDCGEPEYTGTIKRPDFGVEGAFGGIMTGRFYNFNELVGAQGVDGTEDSVYFLSGPNIGELSISGSWVDEQFDLVTEKDSTGIVGMGDGEFTGGVDCAVDSNNNVVTLEKHVDGAYRFQKFNATLDWQWSSSWPGQTEPIRMDFDRGDNQLYVLCVDGIYLCTVD